MPFPLFLKLHDFTSVNFVPAHFTRLTSKSAFRLTNCNVDARRSSIAPPISSALRETLFKCQTGWIYNATWHEIKAFSFLLPWKVHLRMVSIICKNHRDFQGGTKRLSITANLLSRQSAAAESEAGAQIDRKRRLWRRSERAPEHYEQMEGQFRGGLHKTCQKM